MWTEIWEIAAASGIWAVLFLALLTYQLKDSRTREVKYQKVIETLAQDLSEVREVKQGVDEINETLSAYLADSAVCCATEPTYDKEET